MRLRPRRREKGGETGIVKMSACAQVCKEKQRLSNINGSCSVELLLFILILSWLCNVETVRGTGP